MNDTKICSRLVLLADEEAIVLKFTKIKIPSNQNVYNSFSHCLVTALGKCLAALTWGILDFFPFDTLSDHVKGQRVS